MERYIIWQGGYTKKMGRTCPKFKEIHRARTHREAEKYATAKYGDKGWAEHLDVVATSRYSKLDSKELLRERNKMIRAAKRCKR